MVVQNSLSNMVTISVVAAGMTIVSITGLEVRLNAAYPVDDSNVIQNYIIWKNFVCQDFFKMRT